MKLFTASLLVALAGTSQAFVPASRSIRQNVDFGTNLDATRGNDLENVKESISKLALASIVGLSLLSAPLPAMADGQTEKFKLPPIDFTDKSRCSLSSSTIGQANAARDKLYDLRQCKLSGADAPGFDLSGVIMTDTDVSKANFKEAYFSKGYLQCKYPLFGRQRYENETILIESLQHPTLMEPTFRMRLWTEPVSRVARCEAPSSPMPS